MSCASSANLFDVACCPPWAWIDGDPVFSKLNIENRLPCTGGRCSRSFRPATHRRNGFPRYNELSQVDGYLFHPGQ